MTSPIRDYPLPPDETGRQRALESHGVLDSPPEQFYDDAAQLAATVCATPIGAVSLVDNERQWFKSRVGVEATETPRKGAFCAYAIVGPDGAFVVTDARTDERFTGNVLVADHPHVRFYAGAPFVTDEGHALGTVSVMDTAPREITPTQTSALEALSRSVASHLGQRRRIAELERVAAERNAHVEELEDHVRDLEESAIRYREEALVDTVTTGANRRACELHLADTHRRASRYGSTYAVLMIDLDRFKDVNDLHGHAQGDFVLSHAFSLLQDALRASDFLGRYGGDEFIAILPRTEAQGALAIAERMRGTIIEASWPTALPVTVSIGIAVWKRGGGSSLEVLDRADEALYRAKDAGKNRVEGPEESAA